MAIKPTLYWTLVRGWYVGGFTPMRVTTEKPTKLCGTIGDTGTSVGRAKTVGRFKTEIEATTRIEEVQAVRRRYTGLIANARKTLKMHEERELEEIEKAASRGEDRFLLDGEAPRSRIHDPHLSDCLD